MKTYNLIGYSIILTYMLACMYFAPAHLGPWAGLLIGAAYFLFCWSVCGVYLADILHLGIAHRSLDYKEWFMKAVTVVNNSFGLHVDPISWVNRHRLHHKHADHAGDPNKLDGDGFWRTLYLCLMPYQCIDNLATDEILRSRTLQNNHHHYPGLLRFSHDKSEYDFGFITVKVMKCFGLVKATKTGEQFPNDVPLGAREF
jgi:fatty-acid desaturase